MDNIEEAAVFEFHHPIALDELAHKQHGTSCQCLVAQIVEVGSPTGSDSHPPSPTSLRAFACALWNDSDRVPLPRAEKVSVALYDKIQWRSITNEDCSRVADAREFLQRFGVRPRLADLLDDLETFA